MHRCFERVFEDAQAYDDCIATTSIESPTSNTNKLPPSVLDFPDLEGGVERCDCACNYMERQPLTTGLIECVHGISSQCHIYTCS